MGDGGWDCDALTHLLWSLMLRDWFREGLTP